MTLPFITTLSNVATLAVLLGGALAAIVQFRHVRDGKELQAILAIDRSFAEAELQAAFLYVQDELAHKLAQRAYRSELATRGYVDPQTHPEMTVCNWFNEMGMMVAAGFVQEAIVLESFGRLVEHYWRLLGPAIALLRRERGPSEYASFEFLAYRAMRRQQSGRAGSNPSHPPHMPMCDPWAHIDRARSVG